MRNFSAEDCYDYYNRPSRRSSKRTQFGITIARCITLLQVSLCFVPIIWAPHHSNQEHGQHAGTLNETNSVAPSPSSSSTSPASYDTMFKRCYRRNRITTTPPGLLGGPLDWLTSNEDTDYPPIDYETFKRPAKPGKAVNVWTYIRLDHLYEISEDSSTIKLHLTVRLKWNDTRLRFSPSGPSHDAKNRIVKPESIWHPLLRVLKERGHMEPLETVRVASSGEVTYTAHYDSEVWAEIDFRHYPFDSHKFVVDVSSYRYSADRVILNMTQFDPNRVNLEALSGPMWRVVAFNQKSVPNKRTVYLDNDSVVEIEIYVKRRAINPLVVMILPMFLLGILSTTPLFLAVEKFSDRAAIGATGCFTIVMFFFVVNEYFPKMGYLTWLHYYTIFTNIYIFGAFFVIMAIQVIHKKLGGVTDLSWKERWTSSQQQQQQQTQQYNANSNAVYYYGTGMGRGAHSREAIDSEVKGEDGAIGGRRLKENEDDDRGGSGLKGGERSFNMSNENSLAQQYNDKAAYGFMYGYIFFNFAMFASEYENW